MSVKSELRKELKLKRKAVQSREYKDSQIVQSLLSLDCLKKAETILFYASMEDEISTDSAIELALNSGKRVALPVCIDNNGLMRFYYISSLDDTKIGSFNVREPVQDKSNEVVDYSSSICVVPAIAFDKNGFRLGYGKGYYDRFLENYGFISVGLCYNELVQNSLPIDKFDLPVDILITDKNINYIAD